MKKQTFSFFVVSLMTLLLVCVMSSVYAKVPSPRKQPLKAGAQQASSKAGFQNLSKNPYAGALVIDAATGRVLFEENGDAKGYPASITKLMVLLIMLEGLETKQISLQDQVTVTAEAAKIGGSQVYLRENEVFPVDELLYALIVQSANDAAAALAIHFAGAKEGFVDLMNKRAQALGMKDTVFHSVHGLPPGRDQQPDVSTPRDIAKLCQELLKHPDALRYAATKERPFRPDAPTPFIMRSHNHLLRNFEGCDGLKTGYFRAAGFSTAVTAVRKNMRAIAVVFGSIDRKVRDAKARELLSKGLLELAANAPPPAPLVQAAIADASAEVKADAEVGKKDVIEIKKSTLFIAGIAFAVVIILFVVLSFFRTRKPKGPFM